MQILSNLEHDFEAITEYESRDAWSSRLADGSGEAHAYLLQFAAGGMIGRHEAGFAQLLIVLAGAGWVAGNDGTRSHVGTGDVVLFERGEHHTKGSTTEMTALMIQVRGSTAPPDHTSGVASWVSLAAELR